MRNSRALAAAATVAAVLGPAAPAAVADGMGGGGGQSDVIVGGNNGIGPGNIGIGPGNIGIGGNNGFGQGNNHGFNNNGYGQGNNHGGGQGNNNGFNNNGFGPGNGGSRNIVATPNVIAAGGRLTVSVDGCRNGGTMTSTVFRRATLSRIGGNNNTATGTAIIERNTSPGSYPITVNCVGVGGLDRPNAFTVIGVIGTLPGDPHPPIGGSRAGLGGSSSTGATPTDMAIGGGLVAAAIIGGGVFWLRRRSEKRI